MEDFGFGGFEGITDVAPLDDAASSIPDIGALADAAPIDDALQAAYQDWLGAGNEGTIQDFLTTQESTQASIDLAPAAFAGQPLESIGDFKPGEIVGLEKSAFAPDAAFGGRFMADAAPAPFGGSFAAPAGGVSLPRPDVASLAFNPQSFADEAPRTFSRVGIGDNAFGPIAGPVMPFGGGPPAFTAENAPLFVDNAPLRTGSLDRIGNAEMLPVDRPAAYEGFGGDWAKPAVSETPEAPPVVSSPAFGAPPRQTAPFSFPKDVDVSRLPAGMRNNNPGNIKFIPKLGERYSGVVGPSRNTDQGDPQAVFDSPESGMKAMTDLAMRKYNNGKVTANQLIAGQGGWTPGHTAAAANVARQMGLGPNDDLKLNDPEQRFKFARALMQQEHGEASKLYPDQMVKSATGEGNRLANIPPLSSGGEGTPLASRGLGSVVRQGEAPKLITNSADVENLSPSAKGLLDKVLAARIRGDNPIAVNSGYRDPGRNAAAGGAKGSQHIQGNAIDFNVKGWSDEEKQALLNTAIKAGGRGIGIYQSGNTIHIDTRPTPTVWGGLAGNPYRGHGVEQAPEWARGPLVSMFSGQTPAANSERAAPRPSAPPVSRDPGMYAEASPADMGIRIPQPSAPATARAAPPSAPQGRMTMPQISPDEELYSMGLVRDPAGGGMIENIAIRPPGMTMGADGAYIDAGAVPAAAAIPTSAPAGFGGFGGIASGLSRMFGGGESAAASPASAPASRGAGGNTGGSWMTPQMDAFLGGLSAALMSNNGAAFAPTYQAILDSANKKAETGSQQAAIAMVLAKQGLPAEEAALLAKSPTAAQMAIETMKQQREMQQREAGLRQVDAAQNAGAVPASPPPAAPAPAAPSDGQAPAAQPAPQAPAMSSAEEQRQRLQARRSQLARITSADPVVKAAIDRQIADIDAQMKAIPDPVARQKAELELKKLQRDIDSDGGGKIRAEIAARREEVVSQGNNPKDPRWESYIMTGKMPREDAQPLTATDKKAILEADEGVLAGETAIKALSDAKKLSPIANSGYFAGARAKVANNLPDALVPDFVSSPKSGQATAEYENLVLGQALSQLKSIFGAAPTEGERKILLDLQASVEYAPKVREAILDRAMEAAQKRLDFNRQRAAELRGGDFYKAGDKKGSDKSAPKASPSPKTDPLGLFQ